MLYLEWFLLDCSSRVDCAKQNMIFSARAMVVEESKWLTRDITRDTGSRGDHMLIQLTVPIWCLPKNLGGQYRVKILKICTIN